MATNVTAMSDYERQARAYFGDAKVDGRPERATEIERRPREMGEYAEVTRGLERNPYMDTFSLQAEDNYRPREMGEYEEAARPQPEKKGNPWGPGSHDIGDLDCYKKPKKLDLSV